MEREEKEDEERSRGLKDKRESELETMIISSADGGKQKKKRENGRYYRPCDDPWEILNAFH